MDKVDGGSVLIDGTSAKSEKLTFSVALGWGMGSVGVLTLLSVTNALVLKYVVDIMGISALVAGLIVASSRLFDALLDPIMGTVSDATKTRWGRRRPYLLIGAFMCGLAPILIFAAPAALNGPLLLVYLAAALVFYALAYTIFNVPYMAMPVEMTQDRHDRTYLFSFRVYGSALAALIGGGAAPFLVDYFGGGREGFASMSYVLGIAIFVSCLACFQLTAKAPVNLTATQDRTPKFTQIRNTLRNKPFVALMLAKILLVSGVNLATSTIAFFVTIVLDKPLGWLGLYSACVMVGMIGSQVVWLQIAKRRGKRACFLIAAGFYIVTAMSWLLAGPEEVELFLIVRAVALGIFGGGILLSSQAMLPDTLEHEFELTGVRHEGVLTGIYTTVERGASALGVALAGFVLSAGGYLSGLSAAQQPESAIMAIYLAISVFPAVALALSSVAIWKYDLPG